MVQEKEEQSVSSARERPVPAPEKIKAASGAEVAPLPESSQEQAEKSGEGSGPEAGAQGGGAQAASAVVGGRQNSLDYNERLRTIESVLEKDLSELYLSLAPEQKRVFREEGEKTARSINLLLENAKTKAKEIIALIRRWLEKLPGVNRFFVEQEAKIKTDEILRLRNL